MEIENRWDNEDTVKDGRNQERAVGGTKHVAALNSANDCTWTAGSVPGDRFRIRFVASVNGFKLQRGVEGSDFSAGIFRAGLTKMAAKLGRPAGASLLIVCRVFPGRMPSRA